MKSKFEEKKLNPYSVSWVRWYGKKTISCYCPFKPGWPDELYDGGGKGHADQDVDGAQQHVRGFI